MTTPIEPNGKYRVIYVLATTLWLVLAGLCSWNLRETIALRMEVTSLKVVQQMEVTTSREERTDIRVRISNIEAALTEGK